MVVCGGRGAGTRWRNTPKPPAVIGSESEKAVRNGLSHDSNTFHACRLASDAGSSGRGRDEQRERPRPRLIRLLRERGVVAGDDIGGKVGRAPPFTINPTGNTSTSWENFCQAKKASDMRSSPVGSPVLATTTRSKRSGWLGHQPQADQPAPVLTHQSRPRQRQRIHHQHARIHSTWAAYE